MASQQPTSTNSLRKSYSKVAMFTLLIIVGGIAVLLFRRYYLEINVGGNQSIIVENHPDPLTVSSASDVMSE
jgi:hypothetical protein